MAIFEMGAPDKSTIRFAKEFRAAKDAFTRWPGRCLLFRSGLVRHGDENRNSHYFYSQSHNQTV